MGLEAPHWEFHANLLSMDLDPRRAVCFLGDFISFALTSQMGLMRVLVQGLNI